MSDLGMAHALRKRGKSVAQGGASGSDSDDRDADMIARIMKKRSELSASSDAEAAEFEADTDPMANAEQDDVADKDDFIGSIMKKRSATS